MIKTSINRHDLEYFVYAMARAFYKDALILAPDTAKHNMAEDDVNEGEDRIDFVIYEDRLEAIFSKGKCILSDCKKVYAIEKSPEDEAYKDEIRGYIYDVFSLVTGNTLPWGNLTGIRPTKLYMQRLYNDEAIDETKVKAYMKEVYRVSDSKNELGVRIAKTEKSIIDSIHCKDGYSLYIGIPFCPSTCLYCSFTSNPIFSYKDKIDDYLTAVSKEITATNKIMKGYHLDSVYIGGGTPTTLEPSELDRLLSDIVNILPMDEVKEFTVEAGRADSITREKLEVLRKYPVTRISVNPQTMHDKTLKLIGRNHNVSMVINAYNLARELGFDNINMDIILGLPEENLSDVEYTLSEISKLSPESLTVHSLAIKRASRLKEQIDKYNLKCGLDYDLAMNMAIEYADKMGLEPYYLYRQKDMAGNLENTGFAKNGKFGIYNIAMMEEVQTIIACGAGTVTKRVYGDGRIERCDNVKDVALYIDKIDEMIERKRNLFAD